MKAFATFLHQTASPYLDRPVVDQTGLKGAWDFDIQWSYQVPKPGADGIPIFAAVDKLGLKLEAKTAPLPVVFVDSVEETPTPQPARHGKGPCRRLRPLSSRSRSSGQVTRITAT